MRGEISRHEKYHSTRPNAVNIWLAICRAQDSICPMGSPYNPDRRGFFRRLLAEAGATVDEIRGIPQCRISQIPELPDEKLARFTVRIRPEAAVSLRKGVTTAQAPGDGDGMGEVELFRSGERAQFIFNRFDGRADLLAIADETHELFGLEIDEAFDEVKGLFLRLCALGVGAPANLPQLEG